MTLPHASDPTSDTAAAPREPARHDDPVQWEAWELSNQLVLTVKLMLHARHQLPPLVPGGDIAAQPLLFHLKDGPLRVSALADAVHVDVSTVSRQTTQLAKQGLIAKVCDGVDRRVQLVTLTPTGEDVVRRGAAVRREWVGRVLAGWEPDDIASFRHFLEQFRADVERVVRADESPTS